MVNQKNYYLNANEEFLISSTSTLITYFTFGFTSVMKSQLIAYLLSGNECIYLLLGLKVEVQSNMGFVD